MVEDEQLTQTQQQDEQIENAILDGTKDVAQNTIEKTADATKQAIDKATRQAREAAKQATKKAARMAVKAIGQAIVSLISALLPYIAALAVIVALFAGIVYFLEIETAKDTTKNIYDSMGIVETEGDIADIVEIVSDSDGYHLEFIEGFDDKLEEAIKNLNKENKSINLSDKETLKKFIMAEAKTKFPYLQGEEDGTDKFQGSIIIKRYTPDKNIGELGEASSREPVTLKYVDEETFQSYINSADSKALDVYTLDENKNLLTATWSYSGDSGTTMQSNSPMDYRSATARYTMPFEYPLFFLIDSDCPEFCVRLAELAMNSTMEIAIIDNVTDTKTITTVVTTTNETKDIYDVKNGRPTFNKSETTTTTETSSTEVITESVYTSIQVANVESWATKKDCEIKLNSTSQAGTPVTTNSSSPGISQQLVTNTSTKREYVTTGQSIATTITTETYQNSYDVTDSEVEENTENFEKIYKEYEDTLRNNMIPDWLFEIMEENPKTVNMIDLTKYLLYKATGKDYGVKNFEDIDFSALLSLGDIGSTSGSISVYGISLSREDFITGVQNSRCTQVMKDNAGGFYDICKEYNINPAYAFGHACVETGYGTSSICKTKNNYFGMAAYNDSPGASATAYGSILDSVRGYCEWVKLHSTPGTSEYTADNQRGTEFAAVNPVFAGTPSDNIYVLFSRYAVLDSTHHGGTAFDANYMYKALGKGNCGHADGTPTTTLEYSEWAEYTTNERIRIAREIFGTKAFPVVESSTAGDIVNVAKDMMQYMIDNKYNYVQGNYVPLETNESKFGHRVDCSSYVCWVLYRCGYTDASSGGWQLNTDSLPPYLTKKGFKKITSLSELQPGDIVFFPGHVQIYAGKNSSGVRQYFNAGNAPADNSSVYQTYEPSGFLYAYRMPSSVNGNKISSSGDGYTDIYSVGGRKYKLFEQWKGSYAYNIYGTRTISEYGCGPSCASIIVSSYNNNVTPGTLVSECSGITRTYGMGYVESVRQYVMHYGFRAVSKSGGENASAKAEIINHLKSGNTVILLMSGNVKLINGQSYNYDLPHFITLLGINDKNEVFIGDPGSWQTDGYSTMDLLAAYTNITDYILVSK